MGRDRGPVSVGTCFSCLLWLGCPHRESQWEGRNEDRSKKEDGRKEEGKNYSKEEEQRAPEGRKQGRTKTKGF